MHLNKEKKQIQKKTNYTNSKENLYNNKKNQQLFRSIISFKIKKNRKKKEKVKKN